MQFAAQDCQGNGGILVGGAAKQVGGDGAGQAERGGVEVIAAHVAFVQVAHAVGAGEAQLIKAPCAVHDVGGASPHLPEHVGQRFGQRRVVDTHEQVGG